MLRWRRGGRPSAPWTRSGHSAPADRHCQWSPEFARRSLQRSATPGRHKRTPKQVGPLSRLRRRLIHGRLLWANPRLPRPGVPGTSEGDPVGSQTPGARHAQRSSCHAAHLQSGLV
jgi:hypothetical protein